jgi:DNA-binding NarL/FixJ family response regulator
MKGLRGLRVFIVEDEPLISMELQDMLQDLQCEVVAAAGQLDSAVALAESCDFELAILDVNLAGQRIDPVAEIIARRGRPIVFLTGYGKDAVPNVVTARILEKPCQIGTLRRALHDAAGAI